DPRLKLDAVADFGKGNRRNVKARTFHALDPVQDNAAWSGLSQFGNDVRVEQPPVHRSTSRNFPVVRTRGISKSLTGQARSAATISALLGADERTPADAATMVTASLPCTVTVCGPSVWARR